VEDGGSLRSGVSYFSAIPIQIEEEGG